MSYTITIIESDEFLQDLTKDRLIEEGFVVHGACTGKEGVDCIQEHTPDLILLDLDLPDVEANEYLVKIKQDPNCEDVAIIGFSNIGNPADMKCVKDHCLDDVIIKSTATLEDIIASVKKIQKASQ